jgi:hypothetical protein
MSEQRTEITAPEFLEHHLLPGIKKMIEQGFDYLAFPLIAQTVELIGSFFDTNPLDQSGIEATKRVDRFQNGIKHLFSDSVYKNNQGKFYENLRCFFAHQMRPGGGFLLTSQKHGFTRIQHLKNSDSGDRILIIEYFFEDLAKATKRLLNEIKKDQCKIDKNKASQVFLVVKTIQVTSGGTTLSAMASAFEAPACSTNQSPPYVTSESRTDEPEPDTAFSTQFP